MCTIPIFSLTWASVASLPMNLRAVQIFFFVIAILFTASNIPASISFMGDITIVPQMDIVFQVLKYLQIVLLLLIPSSFAGWKVMEKEGKKGD